MVGNGLFLTILDVFSWLLINSDLFTLGNGQSLDEDQSSPTGLFSQQNQGKSYQVDCHDVHSLERSLLRHLQQTSLLQVLKVQKVSLASCKMV